MTVSRIKQPTPSNAANTLRETALVKQLEATKAALGKAQVDLAVAKNATTAARAKLEAVERRPKAISRIAGSSK